MRDGWVETTLGEIAVIRIGRTPPRKEPKYWTTDLARPFLTIAEMNGWSIDPKGEGVTESAELEGKAKRVPAGSLLMSFKLTIGRVGFAAQDVFPNEAIAWLEPKADGVDLAYLALWIEAQDLSAGSGRAVKGNTLNQAAMREIPVSLPRIEEQRRIVDLTAVLDAALARAASVGDATYGAISAMRREFIDLSEQQVALADICSIEAKLVDPKTDENRHLPHLGVDGIESRTGRILDLRTAEEDGVTSGKFRFTENDVVYAKIRPELRKAAFPGFDGLSSADAYPLRPHDGVPAAFLLEVLLSDSFSEQAIARSGRTKMPKINRAELFPIMVALLSRQDQARVASLTTVLRDTWHCALKTTSALRSARGALVALLLSGAHEIPESYDALFAEGASA